jgi:glycosyltransferase involved in cell wall biosynthesis
MKISVVIPAYNEEKRIGRCLQSILDQTEKPDEIIVVDNNCIDGTDEIAQKMGAKIVKEKKQGMICARDAGFDAAQSEIIARTDADTILPKDWISKIKKAFEDPTIGALSGPATYFGIPLISGISNSATYAWFCVLSHILGHPAMFGPNMALRKSVWEKTKPSVCLRDCDVHEDIDLSIHLSKVAKIKFDKDFTIRTTRGRWGRIFTEYVVRLIKMLSAHRKENLN